MRTIKAAVIGTGFIGPAHVEALRRLGFVEVVALAGRNRERTESKAYGMLSLRPCKRNLMPLAAWTGASTM